MRGVYTALITPFDSSNRLDLAAFKKILLDQKDAGITGVIPCGTTGETPTLSMEEKKILIKTAIDTLKGSKVQVIAGTGSNNTQEAVELSKWASDQGADGVLIVSPYYNKPSQAGLEAHFRAVADAIQCEVMLYNVPGRTGVSIAPATVAKLATHPRIRSLKEATGNVAFTSEILDTLKIHSASMDILSGDDATYLPLLCVGATGVVSVASNLFPRAMVAIQKAMDRGDYREAQSIHQRFYPLFRDLFVDSNPVPIKYAMEFVGFCSSRVRLPLAPLSSAHTEVLRASLAQCGVTEGARL
jgi:4-hydroxy-tetrahydrodipicolinate synthase